MTSPPPAWLERVRQLGQDEGLLGSWRAEVADDARTSAVLMLFGNDEHGEVDVVLTQRADGLRQHAGQVSFPGGGVEPQDGSITETALREAEEEIGLRRDGVTVLGELQPIPLAVTNFLVHPVLAWWSSPSPLGELDAGEVARVARVRVADLADPNHRFTATHPRGFQGPAFDVDGLYIWGFTAFVLDAVLTAAGLTLPWDVNDRRQVPDRFLR